MPEQITPLLILFFLLYGAGIAVDVLLCLYLLLCDGKAIAPSITPPVRLRRWAAATFGVMALVHLWWLLFYLYLGDIHSLCYGLLIALDSMAMPTVFVGTLLAMLQDRRRPVWPVVVALIPCAVLAILYVVLPDIDIITPSIVYRVMLVAAFIVYMVVAVRQYGRWLCMNYADLEHKEMWRCHTLFIGFILLLMVNDITDNYVMSIIIHLMAFPLSGVLLWRVETLPQLEEEAAEQEEDILPETDILPEPTEIQEHELSIPCPQREEQVAADAFAYIGELLEKYCEEAQLYLQQDLSLTQLSAAIGTNRSYLSQYFASQGTSYYAYIHDLRIRHFIRRYNETRSDSQPIGVQQLAQESGFHSYSTFSTAFKQRMNQSVFAWMHEDEEE